MQIEMRAGEQSVHVGAHRVERDGTEIEQSGETNDDVQSEREEDVEDREVRDAHPRGAGIGERERKPEQSDANEEDAEPDARRRLHARSPTRSPSRPCGRKTRTRISTMKANTS